MGVLRTVFVLSIFFIACFCYGQSALQPDPADLLQTASQLTNFNNGSGGPWHLHATYTMVNGDGKQIEAGTYEMFWAVPQKSRQSFVSKKFSQTDYVTEKGTLRVGDTEWPSTIEQRVPDALFIRLPAGASLQNYDIEMHPHTNGGSTLRCITIHQKRAPAASVNTIVPTFCLDADLPVLRYSTGIGRNVIEDVSSTLYNHLALFRGHPVSRDIVINIWDYPSVKIHVDVLEDLEPGSEALFVPPANAVPAVPARVYVGQGQMDARVVKRSIPAFGLLSNPTNFDGRGILDIIVGKDGNVRSVRSVMGPTLFENAEIAAAQKQAYQPVVINGQAVEVETEKFYTIATRH